MKHSTKIKPLGRKSASRKALLRSQAKSLTQHKRIFTTLAKAKALKRFFEPILTKTKKDSLHTRRTVFSYFQDKLTTKKLFSEIAPKISHRAGGYTRVIRLAQNRKGDAAPMAMIELVDFNKFYTRAQKKTRKRKRGKGLTNSSLANTKSVAEPQRLLPEEKKENNVTAKLKERPSKKGEKVEKLSS